MVASADPGQDTRGATTRSIHTGTKTQDTSKALMTIYIALTDPKSQKIKPPNE